MVVLDKIEVLVRKKRQRGGKKKEASLEALQFSDVEKVLFGIFIPKILSTKPALLFNNNKKKRGCY